VKCNFFAVLIPFIRNVAVLTVKLVLQLAQSFCKPDLLHATECLQLSHTAIIKLKAAWFCALSKIFHVTGNDVEFISEMCERYCFETEVANI